MIRTLSTAMAGAAIAISAPAAAQEAVGHWQGTLQVADTVSLRAVVTIERGPDGILVGTFDSPDQNALGIPLADIQLSAGKLTFSIPSISGRYEGTWDPAGQAWNGTFSQAGNGMPLVLTAGDPAARPGPEPLPADWSIPDDAALGALLEKRIALREGAGMVLGVVEPAGPRIVARGPASGRKFDGDTVFEIGSMTKVFTSLLLADMALRGEVSLDDPVAKYLPRGAAMPERNGKAITLRHLSLQTSGLPRIADNMPLGDPQDPYADYTEEHLLEFLASHRLRRDPAEEYEYSNIGIGLLGYVLARAAGTDFESLVQDRILAPLDMSDSGIALSPGMRARFATPHDEFMRTTKPWTLPVLAGAGALRSTANDMLEFLAAALDPASSIAPAMRLTLSDRLGEPGERQSALGWLVEHPPTGEVLHHNGGTGGFRSFMALQPGTGRAVVGLINSAAEPSAQDIALHALIGAPVAEAGPPPDAPRAVDREEVTLTPTQLDHVVGTYRLTPEIEVAVHRDAQRLMAQLTGQPAFQIYPESPLSFFWKVVDAQVRFTEENGEVTGAVLTQNGQTMPMEKVE